MKRFVRNRARPDLSMAKDFLTYECISFCQNYLSIYTVGIFPTVLVFKKNLSKHRELGCWSAHQDAPRQARGIWSPRGLPLTPCRHSWSTRRLHRAHRVTLQHLQLIEPWAEERKSLIEHNYIDLGRPRKKGDVTREHNSSFTRWFKKRQLVQAESIPPATEDENSYSPYHRAPGTM